MYVHLSDAAVTPGAPLAGEFGRVENTRGPVHAEQIRQWCGNPDAQVTVQPVIDLNEHIDVEAYEIRGRLREQTVLTHPTCVFPWCTRPARALEPDEHDADCDHRVPYAVVQHSCSCNAAPLCRRHHRAKTHGRWTYTALDRGTYVWTSPHGYQYLRDAHGTLDVSRDRHPHPPDPCTHPRSPDPGTHPPPDRLTPPPRTPPDHHRRGHRHVRTGHRRVHRRTAPRALLTGSTTERRPGLDKLDHRASAWPRQARPPWCQRDHPTGRRLGPTPAVHPRARPARERGLDRLARGTGPERPLSGPTRSTPPGTGMR